MYDGAGGLANNRPAFNTYERLGICNDTKGNGDWPKVFRCQRRKKKIKKRDLMKGYELFL